MEGPGVRAIAERLAPLAGDRVSAINGKSRFPLGKIRGRTLRCVYNVGKLLFLEFPVCTLRIHFLMWGRYRLNDEIPGKIPRLTLSFDGGSILRFYATAIALLPNREVKALYDPSLDPLDPDWDPKHSAALVAAKGDEIICDTLMDQEILPGVGNIIKNEALFTARVHPGTPSGCIPAPVLARLLVGIRDFSLTMYRCDTEGKRIQPHLRIYRKKTCPECGGKVEHGNMGALGRITFWCPACQVKYRCQGSRRRSRHTQGTREP